MTDSNKPDKAFTMLVAGLMVILIGLVCLVGYRKSQASAGVGGPGQGVPAAGPQTLSGARGGPEKSPGIAEAASAGVRSRLRNVPLGRLVSPSILIEKSKRRLTVLDGGRAVKQYPAAVGANQGDKTREGDLKTPEGRFYVCTRNLKSKYILSLGLSYPDIEDAKRGLRAGQITRAQHDKIVRAIRRKAQPPWNTKLGGEIMIHGRRLGGRATLGCIALEDNDIRELFPQIPHGTEVIIRP
ncbi:MAG: L,D-transpeptidase [Phycisphaerae bacterium]|nr:L,D-transpeptidase [Phycisphaerae bacterium]